MTRHTGLKPNVTNKQVTHPYLQLVKIFEIEVPTDFTLDNCSRDGFSFWNLNATDRNLKSTIIPCQKYNTEIYRLKSRWGSEGLIELSKENNRILGGALGGALLCSRYGVELPTDRWVICIEEEKHLWRNARGLHVPAFVRSNGGWSFDLIVSSGWFEGNYVVFFCQISGSQA